MLRDIWRKWPGTDIAVRAQLFYLEIPGVYGSEEIEAEQSIEFIRRAFESPDLYFSSKYQASTQSVAIRLIRWYAENTSKERAWQQCVRLRWLAPRIDLIAPVCQSLTDQSTGMALTSKLTRYLLPPGVAVSEIPAENLSRPLLEAVQYYLSRPYDADAMGKAILELYKGGFDEISIKLVLELLEIDPMEVPKIEVAIDKLKVAGK